MPYANAATKFPVGTWWSLYGSYQTSASGTGGASGSYVQKGNYSIRILVANASVDGSLITFLFHSEGTSICAADGTFSCSVYNLNSYSYNRYYTIAPSTLTLTRYVASNGQLSNFGVGHSPWFMVDPTALADGGKSAYVWCTPTSDDKSCVGNGSGAEVQASVSTAQLSLKGNSVKVWVRSYTGTALGQFRNNQGAYSVGPLTVSYQYDPAYGIWLGGLYNGTANGTYANGGGWTDSYVEHDYIADTSLKFNAAASVSVQPAGVIGLVVDGVTYAPNQLPTTFTWILGTAHTIVANSTVQSGNTRYVFLHWGDGSTSNTRQFTLTQDWTVVATYKTQYMLTVQSDYGNPQGSGWYDAGTQATFSTSPIPQLEPGLMGALGGKIVFQGWIGSANVATFSAAIAMDGPKTVTALWAADNTQPYMILGGMIAAIIIILAAAIVLIRRKKR